MKKKTAKEKITKEMMFIEVLHKYPETADVFLRHGMACIGCPMAMSETIEQGCLAHGIDPDKLAAELNKKTKKGKK
jgi:hybrid cluster-associated redox disulfide protein